MRTALHKRTEPLPPATAAPPLQQHRLPQIPKPIPPIHTAPSTHSPVTVENNGTDGTNAATAPNTSSQLPLQHLHIAECEA